MWLLSLWCAMAIADGPPREWDEVYSRAKLAHGLSYSGPGLSIGGTTLAMAFSKNPAAMMASVLPGMVLGGIGVSVGTPVISWSAMRGRRALVEQGHRVTWVPGAMSWASTGLAAGGVAIAARSFIAEDGGHLGLGLGLSVAGSLGAYGFGLAQWSLNGVTNHREIPQQLPPLELRISGSL